MQVRFNEAPASLPGKRGTLVFGCPVRVLQACLRALRRRVPFANAKTSKVAEAHTTTT